MGTAIVTNLRHGEIFKLRYPIENDCNNRESHEHGWYGNGKEVEKAIRKHSAKYNCTIDRNYALEGGPDVVFEGRY